MELTPSQAIIAKDTHRFRVLVCGRKFGKTELAIEEILGVALSKQNKEIAYLATNYGEARDIAWTRMLKKYEPIIRGKPNETRLEMSLASQDSGTSRLQLRGWESVETMRGREFDFLVLDETQNYKNFWMYWQEVLRPTLTPRRGSVLFLGTPKGFTHLYDLYNLEQTDNDFRSFHFTSYDNPFIPVEEIEAAKKQMTEDRFAQEYLADFRKTEGLVFKEFNREIHLFGDEEEKTIYQYEKIAGVDFGYTNPAAIPFIVVDAKRHYWITNEYYQSRKTEAEIADYVALQSFQRVYPDPEAPSAIEELKRRGVNTREVIKGKDSIISGIQEIRELFKSNRIHIHKRCLNLIYELEVYSYPDKKDARNESELPIDENNHLIDALRYALATQEKIDDRTPSVSSYTPSLREFRRY